jgi:hypothetical protein
MRSFVLLTKYRYEHHIEENEVSGACRMHGREKKMHIKFWKTNLKQGDHIKISALTWTMILKLIFRKRITVWPGFTHHRIGKGEHSNEYFCFIKCKHFLDQLSNYQLAKNSVQHGQWIKF